MLHPEEDTQKHDAAFKIFHYTYNVRVMQSVLMKRRSPRYERVMRNPANVQDVAGQMQLTNMTPARIAYLISIGQPVEFVNSADALAIYNMFAEHIRDWREHVLNGIHVQQPPLEDLERLQNAMIVIYPIVRNEKARIILEDDDAPLTDMERYLYGRRGGRAAQADKRIEAIKEIPTEQSTMVDRINQLGFERGHKWNE